MLTFLVSLLTWTPALTLQVQQITSVHPSPDGQSALYTTPTALVTPQSTYPLDHPRALYSSTGQIAVSSSCTLYLLDQPLATTDEPIVTFAWSPNGSQIAYATASALYLLTLPDQTTLLPTQNSLIDNLTWSPDGTEITYTSAPDTTPESIFFNTHLITYHLPTETTTPIDLPGAQSRPYYSPDGRYIAYIQSELPPTYEMDRTLALYDRATQTAHPLTPAENWGPVSLYYTLLGWTPDSSALICLEPHHTQNRLLLIPIADPTPLPLTLLHAEHPILNPTGTHLGFVSETPNTPPEAYILPLSSAPTQLTHLNDSLPPVPHTTTITYLAPDGLPIEALLTLPDGPPPYPLILSLHGGPMYHWYDKFTGSPYPHPTAPLASAGFAVLRPNIRGSTGYGHAFRLANHDDWGNGPLQDALAGIDHLISLGLADPDRLAIVGWSYGGYLAAYAITQTDRFKTALIGAPLIGPSFTATSDLPHLLPHCMPTSTDYPINHIASIHTPLLLQHGTADTRCPYSQSLEFAQALDAHHKSYHFTSYPDTPHDPAPTILPIMEENLTWLLQPLD
ncbi:MAG: alpha/beta fold hydrolase [Candidatus Obscuribacterales bacterium]